MKEKIFDKNYLKAMTEAASALTKQLLAEWQKTVENAIDKGYTMFRIEYWDKNAIDKRLLKFKIGEGISNGWFFGVKSGLPYMDFKFNKESAKILKKIIPARVFGIAHIFIFDESKTRVIRCLNSDDISEKDPFVGDPFGDPTKNQNVS